MSKLRRTGFVTILLIACVGCDQLSKDVVRNHIPLGDTQAFMRDTVRLTHTENPGAFLSMGASLPRPARVVAFQGGVALLVLGLLWSALFARQLEPWRIAGFTMLAASGVGNLIDRLLCNGLVTDFLNVGFGPIRTGIFNVADVVGLIGLAVLILRRPPAPSDTSSKAGHRE